MRPARIFTTATSWRPGSKASARWSRPSERRSPRGSDGPPPSLPYLKRPPVAVLVPGRTSLPLERDVRVAMPDGIALATDVLRPDTSAPVPALLIRTPYGRDPSSSSDMVDGIRLVEAGYAVVGQDVRGR